MNNKPEMKKKDGVLQVSFFKNRNEKGEYYSVSIQRSRKDQNGEWRQETIHVYPEDLLKVHALTFRAYNAFVEAKEVEKDGLVVETTITTSEQYAAQSDGDLNDFVPF